jgi:hypothetical protein
MTALIEWTDEEGRYHCEPVVKPKITIPPLPQPAEPQPRRCDLCQETRQGWEFTGATVDICWDCAGSHRFSHTKSLWNTRRGSPGESFWQRPGATRDMTLMNEALALCRALQTEGK